MTKQSTMLSKAMAMETEFHEVRGDIDIDDLTYKATLRCNRKILEATADTRAKLHAAIKHAYLDILGCQEPISLQDIVIDFRDDGSFSVKHRTLTRKLAKIPITVTLVAEERLGKGMRHLVTAQKRKLRMPANIAKGDTWMQESTEDLLKLAYEEMAELADELSEMAIRPSPMSARKVIDECADVANFLAMIVDKHRNIAG